MKHSPPLEFDFLRRELIGVDAPIQTAFGERLMMYADYTASGRCLSFVENYLRQLQRIYANTHTEDNISGRSMTKLLKEAEEAQGQEKWGAAPRRSIRAACVFIVVERRAG